MPKTDLREMARDDLTRLPEPKYLTLDGGVRFTGLSHRTIREAVDQEAVESYVAKLPGNKTGRRLILRASLESWIESGCSSPAVSA